MISAEERLITGKITKRLLRRLEKASDKIMKSYIQLAAGRKVRHYNQQNGEHIYTEFEADAPTTRHAIDKFLAPAKQEIELSGTFKVVKMDSYDPDNEIDVTPRKTITSDK